MLEEVVTFVRKARNHFEHLQGQGAQERRAVAIRRAPGAAKHIRPTALKAIAVLFYSCAAAGPPRHMSGAACDGAAPTHRGDP